MIVVAMAHKFSFILRYVEMNVSQDICACHNGGWYYMFLGRMILSGGSDGLVAVSSRTTGMTVRVISDHQGAPVTGIDVQQSPVCTLSSFYYWSLYWSRLCLQHFDTVGWAPHQEEHPACKKWVMRCWHGCLSGVRCKWFAYGLADATGTPIISCFIKIKIGLTVLVAAYHGYPEKEGVEQMMFSGPGRAIGLVCVCGQKLFVLNDLWPRYLVCCFTLTLSWSSLKASIHWQDNAPPISGYLPTSEPNAG